jgi:hypothetical protein
MKIPLRDEILMKAKEYGLQVIETWFGTQKGSTKGNACLTQEESLDKFMQDVLLLNKNHFFLYIDFWKMEKLKSYLISMDSIAEKKYGILYTKIKQEAKHYNNQVMKHWIDKPMSVELFVFVEGIAYSLKFIEEWFLDLKDPRDILFNLSKEDCF